MSDAPRGSDFGPYRPPPSSASTPGAAGERSFRALFLGALGNVQEILRSEIRLAKVEVQEDLAQFSRAAAVLAVGLVLGLAALGLLLLAAVYALALVLPAWAGALLVAAAVGVLGGALALVGLGRLRRASLKPDKALQSLKETVEWARDRT